MNALILRLRSFFAGRVLPLALAATLALATGCQTASPPAVAGPAIATAEIQPPRKLDVVYVPTPQSVVDRMLELAEIRPGDVVYDLGCGDGRIVVTAAKQYGVKAVGYDIDPQRVKEARENVAKAGVGHLVRIEQADIFTLDLTGASVITLYLLPSLNVRLMPQLARMKPGSRIVSHNFDMQGAKPVLVEQVNIDPNDADDLYIVEDGVHSVYKWVVPWEPESPAQ